MTSLPAKVIAIEKRGDQYQVIVQIGAKYRGSFNTLAFGEVKPYMRIRGYSFSWPLGALRGRGLPAFICSAVKL